MLLGVPLHLANYLTLIIFTITLEALGVVLFWPRRSCEVGCVISCS